MFPHKHVFAYVFLGIYVSAFVVGVLILVGTIATPTAPIVGGVFGLLVAQTALLLAAILKAPNYFEDPPAMAKVVAEYEKTIAEYRDVIAKNERLNAQLVAKLYPKPMALADLQIQPADK